MAGYEGKNCSQSMIHHFPSSSYHYRDNSYMSEKIFTIQHYLCLSDINECSPNPCENGATCADELNDYTCTCIAGYDGKNCSQSKLNHLSLSTCK